ncbi:MAG: hypothetical protein QW348_07595 [Ignisphaera sp.]
MRLGKAREYAKMGLREALFTLKTNALSIALIIVLIIILFPLAIYNMLRSESLALLPNEAKLQMVLPIVSINNLVVALLVGVTAAAAIDQERLVRVFEYLVVYSPYTAGEFLFIKMLSAVVVGAVAVVPYVVATYIIINMFTSINLLLPILLILSLLISIASLTLLLSLVSLLLEPKLANLVRTVLLIAVTTVAPVTIYKSNQSIKDIQALSTLASNMAGPLYVVSLIGLIAFIILYYIYRDRIVELALRW